MKEKNRYFIKKAINELPAFKLKNEGIWEVIEAKLDKETGPKTIFDKLPKFQAPSDLWGKIEQKLDKKNNRKPFYSLYFMARAAAVIVLLIAIDLFINYQHIIKLSVQTSKTEKVETIAEKDIEFESIYNPAICMGNPEICNTPIFKMLDGQLTEVKEEIDKLKNMIQKSDPQMMKYFHRLINEKVEIEKKMVKIIIES